MREIRSSEKITDTSSTASTRYFRDGNGRIITHQQLFDLPLHMWKLYQEVDPPKNNSRFNPDKRI